MTGTHTGPAWWLAYLVVVCCAVCAAKCRPMRLSRPGPGLSCVDASLTLDREREP